MDQMEVKHNTHKLTTSLKPHNKDRNFKEKEISLVLK